MCAGLLASVKKEMAGLPRVSYRNLALPAMTLTFVDRWSSPTCKLVSSSHCVLKPYFLPCNGLLRSLQALRCGHAIKCVLCE